MSDLTRLVVIAGVLVFVMTGWGAAGSIGAAIGLALGLVLLVLRWRRLPLWAWLGLYLSRGRRIELTEPMTVANDRSGGGVRYQRGVVTVAVQILGKRYQPTYLTGSTGSETTNTVDITELFPAMRQSLGLTIESISVISSGARRRATGDYPRVYDTLIGAGPYAGQRETWLVIRIRALDNGDALRWRTTLGSAALAAAQRVTMMLRCQGIRARVATTTDIVELEKRLGRSALQTHNRRWQTTRSDAGWQTVYGYRPEDITTDNLAQAWALRADGVVQNVTLFPDGTASATVLVRTAQPPTAPPAVLLQPLPGEQAQAVQANLCGPRPTLRALGRAPLRGPVTVPIGPSGVLLGRTMGGDRLLLPLSDPAEQTRIHIRADDMIAKRIVIRAAAAGEKVTVHTTNLERWDSVRMPTIAVIEHPRPVTGSTISVIDGTVPPAPRPSTVISIADPGSPTRVPADIVITQTGPATIEVDAGGERYDADVDYFRAENRYLAHERPAFAPEREMVG